MDHAQGICSTRTRPSTRSSKIRRVLTAVLACGFVLAGIATIQMFSPGLDADQVNAKSKPKKKPAPPRYTVLAFNELGMHCMNQDFSEICILPPFNTLRAQVIDRSGEEPHVITKGVTVQFAVPGNSTSSNKTNFWDFAPELFGVALPSDVGLTGNTLAGAMKSTGDGRWEASGIPLTPLTDKFQNDPFQLSLVTVKDSKGKLLATTQAVVPVSWEINCNLCHTTPGISVATDILRKHDKLHGTTLEKMKPVLCASCHADPALGAPGHPGVSAFSHAMHRSHSTRMSSISGQVANSCYACHPGVQTECQRDVHLAAGITCTNCHGGMAAVGDKSRVPWQDEPTCGQCHQALNPKFAYEEPGKLFKESRGHGGVYCATCHGPQHATGPAVTAADNVQAVLHQGHPGVISDCTVCHTKTPKEKFFHSRDD